MKTFVAIVLIYAVCLGSSLLSRANEQSQNRFNRDFEVKLEDLGPLDKEKKLYIYTWFDQISPKIIGAFFRLTGIRVIVDVFDCNETLEAKLLTGNCSYDIVFPTAWPFFYHQMKAGVFQKMDTKRLSKYRSKLDKYLLDLLADVDPQNEYAIPFTWGINGIGVNMKIVNRIAPDIPLNSWAILFDPRYAKKLQAGGISLLESPEELFAAVFVYLNFSEDKIDLKKANQAIDCLRKVRRYIGRFDSYSFQDLASGSACAVMCSSGDLMFARTQTSAESAKYIRFIIPKEGACLSMEVMAVPKKAKHVNNARAFIAFLLHPRVSAEITEYTGNASAIPESRKYVSEKLSRDPSIYPNKDRLSKCQIKGSLPHSISRHMGRALTKIKSKVEPPNQS
ncbi:MAG: extracellular solute-binding protein [Holosporales bacterium]|jgi:putative spermidine/putrescine transport system substrate-binding protein/putrescine transport system substrate-binding protein|nr:extracellular solute-binding protein [Holosporales bacterium]